MAHAPGMRYCHACGLPLPADTPACAACGAARAVTPAQRAEALAAQGYHLLPDSDANNWCRICSSVMYERSSPGRAERVCPECGFSGGHERCTLLSCTSGEACTDRFGQRAYACTIAVLRPGQEQAQWRCLLYGAAALPAQPGTALLVYYTDGCLGGFGIVEAGTIYPAVPLD